MLSVSAYLPTLPVCFDNPSQTMGPKGLEFSGFDGDYPGVITRKFGEDKSKTLPVGIFPPKFPEWSHNSMP